MALEGRYPFPPGGRIGARPALPTGCQCLLSHQLPFSLRTRRRSAPTSAHRCLSTGLGAGPLPWSSLCSEKAPAQGTPPPQREGPRMAASRPGTPPLGVPAPRRLPDAAGSQVGSRQVGRPPPQCPRGGRRLGEPPVPMGATRGGGGDPGRHLLAPRMLPRAEPAAGPWSPAEAGVVSGEATEKCVRQSLSAPQRPAKQ